MTDDNDTSSPPESGDDPLIDALSNILRTLLYAMDGLSQVGRRLHPTTISQIPATVTPLAQKLGPALTAFQAQSWPDELEHLTQAVVSAAEAVNNALSGLEEAAAQPEGMFHAYRALRYAPRAAEALYPLAGHLPALSQYFLEDAARDDTALLAALSNQQTEAQPHGEQNTGVMHAQNGKQERGGFSLYVPENYDPNRKYPVITALHGGSGHGRAFLWTWLRQARTRGAILIAPTSIDATWSLMQPEKDSANIQGILDMVAKEWQIDTSRLLLTGMSDGGTFSYLCGGASAAPFTHLAPISASFQPMLLEFLDKERLRGLPLYLIHGALDWMFPVDIARGARASLTGAGVDVVYREIADLSHTYPVEENSRIMDWFLNGTKPTD
jgi:phospholipase/carboxylesterase